VLPPAGATVPPWLPAKSARVSNLLACCALGPPASAAQYSCRREPCTEPSDHEHGPYESDDHAYADEQIGENDSGALLYDHGPSVGRMASPVHHRLTPGHEIFLRGRRALKKCPTLKI